MISHFHQTVFIHIPKNAGQSIEKAFLSDLGLSWQNRAPLLLRPKVECDNNSPPRLAHLTASQYTDLKYIPPRMYKSYFKFCVCRNPWDRAYSLYKYLTDQSKPFAQFVKDDFKTKVYDNYHWFAMSQAKFILDKHGNPLVDKIIRYENLALEFKIIAKKLNLKTTRLMHTNKSINMRCLDYQSVYCESSKAIISELYAEDIELLDYSFM